MSAINSKKRRLFDQAILLGFASVVFICIRIMSISRGNLVLAETLASNLDPLKIFVSSIIPLANIICLLLGVFILQWGNQLPGHQDQTTRSLEKSLTKFLGYFLLLIALLFINLMMIIGFILFAVLDVARKSFLRLKAKERFEWKMLRISGDSIHSNVSLVVASIFLFYTLFVPTMWVPTENMYVKSVIAGNHDTQIEKSPITVYVVNETPSYLTTLDAFTMVPEIYRTEDVLGRQICTEDKKMIVGSLLSWAILNWNSKTLGRGWTCQYPSNISLFGKHFNFTF